MKNQKKRKSLLVILLCLLLSALLLTSCEYDLPFADDAPDDPSYDSAPDSKEENDATQKPTGDGAVNDTPVGDTTTSITITGDKSDMVYAAAKGLRSAVSVYCNFTVTTLGGSLWNPYPVTQTYSQTGSGVLYQCESNGSAFIITNFHVVYNAASDNESNISESIYLYLYGMESEKYAIPALYVGGSSQYDIAVLRVEKSEILAAALSSQVAAPVTVGSYEGVVPGEAVVAIGNPSATGLSGISVTKGIISVDSEYITMSSIDGTGQDTFRVIRTDTPINGGNSGGGMYNVKGELVGIVNAKITHSSIENIGYAIPVSVACGVAENLIANCYNQENTGVVRAALGVTLSENELSTKFDPETGLITRKEEIAVASVAENSIAAEYLQAEDVLLSLTLQGKTTEIYHAYHYLDAMLWAREGDTVTLTVLRDGEEITVHIPLSADCFGIS